ncbi:hypothetical protein GCM10010363_22310 [Streptomyces omiyaensis]|nr:hypothetical protein GCM10010363_22310 [Streptomyces omiyaensis]
MSRAERASRCERCGADASPCPSSPDVTAIRRSKVRPASRDSYTPSPVATSSRRASTAVSACGPPPGTGPIRVQEAAPSPERKSTPSGATPYSASAAPQETYERTGPAPGAKVLPPSVLRATPLPVVASTVSGAAGETAMSRARSAARSSQTARSRVTRSRPFALS